MRDERLALRPGREMHTFYSYYGFSRNRKPSAAPIPCGQTQDFAVRPNSAAVAILS